MLPVAKFLPRSRGLAPALLKRAAAVVLDWDTRRSGRFDSEDSQGRALAVALPRGSVLRGGDVLVAEDGSLVKVIATPQPVMVVRCAGDGSALALLRAAYHLGSWHVPLELQADRLQFEPDHVLAEMLRQVELSVTEELAPFEPEDATYGAAASHGDHAHAHDARDADAAKAHPPHGHGHVHGPDCGHDHH